MHFPFHVPSPSGNPPSGSTFFDGTPSANTNTPSSSFSPGRIPPGRFPLPSPPKIERPTSFSAQLGETPQGDYVKTDYEWYSPKQPLGVTFIIQVKRQGTTKWEDIRGEQTKGYAANYQSYSYPRYTKGKANIFRVVARYPKLDGFIEMYSNTDSITIQ